jgi:hypothetical protein
MSYLRPIMLLKSTSKFLSLQLGNKWRRRQTYKQQIVSTLSYSVRNNLDMIWQTPSPPPPLHGEYIPHPCGILLSFSHLLISDLIPSPDLWRIFILFYSIWKMHRRACPDDNCQNNCQQDFSESGICGPHLHSTWVFGRQPLLQICVLPIQ